MGGDSLFVTSAETAEYQANYALNSLYVTDTENSSSYGALFTKSVSVYCTTLEAEYSTPIKK